MKLLYAFLISLVIAATVYAAGGLSSNWGEIVIEKLETGKSYDLNKYAGAPFTIVNNFDSDVNLQLKVLQPQPNELKPGYEAIPDVSWVKLEKEEINIGGLKKEVVNVKLTIPNDKKYAGKKYHVWIWTYTSGQAMGVGLKSRILFAIRN
jgi:hypothetical protein